MSKVAPNILIALPMAYQDGMDKYKGIIRYLSRKGLDWNISLDRCSHGFVQVRIGDLGAFDGAIIDGGTTRGLVVAAAKSHIPLVGIDWRHPEIGKNRRHFIQINADNTKIGRLAASALTTVGNFASYAFLPLAKEITWSNQRGASFTRALQRRHHKVTLLDSSRPLSAQIRQLPKPAAIFAANDIVGNMILSACARDDIAVPMDVSVLGVDNEQIICHNSFPPLASIQPDYEESGFAAAQALDALLKGRPHVANKLYPVRKIISRHSIEPPRSAGHLVQRALALITDECTNFSNINGLARLLGVSRRLLDCRFRETLSKSVLETIIDTRLEKVCNDLKSTNLPIAEICASSNLGSGTNPLRVFKRRYGLTMSAYRRQNRNLTGG